MNIYISGLSYGINDADLNELFSAYGETSSAKVIMDRESGKIQRIWFRRNDKRYRWTKGN